MSDTQRAAVALRTVIVGGVGSPFDAVAAGDSLPKLNVAQLPDGAEAYVLSTKSTYRLNKFSTQAPVSDTFVRALGGGVWAKQNALSDFTFTVRGTATMTAGAGIVPVQNTWSAIPSASSYYAVTPKDSNFWALDNATGIITYSGPDGKIFLVAMTASMEDSNSGTPQQLEWDITSNGALVGTTGATQSAVTAEVSGTAGLSAEYVHNFVLNATPSATYQHVFRCVTATPGTMSLKRYQVAIIAI